MVAVVVEGRHRAQLLDCVGLLALSTVARVALNHHGLIRVSHALINLNPPGDPRLFHNFGYPVSLNGLMAVFAPLAPSGTSELDLALALILGMGCLTPAAFYVLCRLLGATRGLAVVIGLLVALNPTHILYSTNYDLFVPSVLLEVVAHSLLIVFLRTGSLAQFGGFFLASAVFYHARPENAAIFYFHLACLGYAIWKLPNLRRWLVPLTVLFAAYHIAYQIDWFTHVRTGDNHVITGLWTAPLGIVFAVFNPKWNALLDWRWSPPYVLALILLGIWASWRKREPVHIYALVVFAAFLAIYHDIRVPSPIGNSRFFLNVLPATALFSLTALQWLHQRYSRTPQIAAAVIALSFVPYVPSLAQWNTIQSQEARFFHAEVAPRLQDAAQAGKGGATLWRQFLSSAHLERVSLDAWNGHPRLTQAEISNEFDENHLDLAHVQVTHDAHAVPAGGWLWIGASCYEFSAEPGKLTPECAAEFRDPRNRIVAESPALPTKPYHRLTPWWMSGAWEGFAEVRFYLLRREGK